MQASSRTGPTDGRASTGSGALDTWLRRMEQTVADAGVEEVAELCVAYQAAQTLRSTDRKLNATERRKLKLGEQAAARLLEQYWKMLWGQVCAALPAGSGAVSGRADLEERRQELLADLHVCLLEAAGSFDPEKGTFTSFLVSMLTSRLKDRAARPQGDLAGVPEIWERVARIAERVRGDLVAAMHREPTADELHAEVRRYCLGWARKKLSAEDLESAGGDVEEAARRKLVRQGTWAAIGQLTQVLEARRGMLRLDAVGPDGETTLLDLQPAAEADTPALERVLRLIGEQDRRMLEMRLGAHDGREWRYEEIAEVEDLAWPEVRRRIKHATAAVLTPHAQYARLAGGIEAQFEDEIPVSPLDRFLHRTEATPVR